MPATLPQRTMRYDAAKRLLTMTIPRSSKKTDYYAYEVETVTPDDGFWDHPVRCFRITNQETSEVYDVAVDVQQVEEPVHSCDCPGFAGHGHKGTVCKHIAALLALVRANKI